MINGLKRQGETVFPDTKLSVDLSANPLFSFGDDVLSPWERERRLSWSRNLPKHINKT